MLMPFRFVRKIAIAFFFLLFTVHPPWNVAASSRLTAVTPEMEKPEYWLKKIKNPNNPLLTPEEVEKMNEDNLRKKDLSIFRIKDLKPTCTGEQLIALLNEDWQNYGKTAEVRLGKKDGAFRNDLIQKLNQKAIKKKNPMLFGLIVKRTDIRAFPTDEPSPGSDGFDQFQHSSISPGAPVGIYYFTQGKSWAYIQAQMIRGWIHTDHLAIAKEKNEVSDYEAPKNRLVVTGNVIQVFADSSFRQPIFLCQMGDSFPLLALPEEMKIGNRCYVISIPRREGDGQLSLSKGYIRWDEDVHRGFLPYTQANLARQVFKMLNHPYGWGDRLGGRDCSRLIMDLFRVFGILMPRNSKEQSKIGVDLGAGKELSRSEKINVLNHAVPLITTLRLPGHIMLYLGNNKGHHYIIHSLWGIQESERRETIGKVVVSDLNLGDQGPNGSLLERVTGLRMVGPISQIQIPISSPNPNISQ